MPGMDGSIPPNSGNISMQDFVRMQQSANPMRVPSAMAPQMAHQHGLTSPTSRTGFPRGYEYLSEPPQNLSTSQSNNNSRKPMDYPDSRRVMPSSPTTGFVQLIAGK